MAIVFCRYCRKELRFAEGGNEWDIIIRDEDLLECPDPECGMYFATMIDVIYHMKACHEDER
jgi:hypothetical protein